jgi:hypothetical protein
VIVSDELLRIQASDLDEAGSKLEPEEKPAERIVQFAADADGHLTGERFGQLPVSIATQGTVQEFAQECKRLCANCKHFDLAWWQKYKLAKEATQAGKAELRMELAKAFSATGNVEIDPKHSVFTDPNVEAAINYLGICRPLTDIASLETGQLDEVIVHPFATCPPGIDAFTSKNVAAEKAGAGGYDEVMRRAQGRL